MVPDSTADPPVSPTGSSPDTIARYFDTSVLRGCSSDLVHLAGRDSSRTSALAILELIAKADESDKEFRARRAAIRAVRQADLSVEWVTPEEKEFNAFPILARGFRYDPGEAASLKALSELLAESEALDDFAAATRRSSLAHDPGYFRQYLGRLDDLHTRLLAQLGADMRAKWPPSGAKTCEVLGLPSDLTLREFGRTAAAAAIGRSSMLYAYAVALAILFGRPGDVEFERELYECYDGSLDRYLDASAVVAFERPAAGAVPAHNDGADLAHFKYLSPETALVTLDQKMLELGRRTGKVAGPASLADGPPK